MPTTQNPFRTIFESAVEGVVVCDAKGEILLANASAHNLFGYSPGALPGTFVEELVPGAARPSHKKYREDFSKNPVPRQMGHGRDLTGLKADGASFPIEVSLSPTKIDNRPVVIAFVIDITERKEAEKEIARSQQKLMVYAAELEKKVSKRTEELAMAINDLENINAELEEEIRIRIKAEEESRKALEREKELNELKSRFVSLASHEFRTPLSTILSSTSLISRYSQVDQEPQRQKHISRIKKNVQDLTNLLSDFLDLEKFEEGKVVPKLEQIEFCQIVEEAVDEMRGICKEGQEILFDQSRLHVAIEGDVLMLKNILLNLLSNAVKYSPAGSSITLNCEVDQQNLTFEISDQGMGIPKKEQKHLFERFFRARNASGIQGTGLGLYLVKKYVEQLTGRVTFISELERGTTFRVTLPLSQNKKKKTTQTE